MTGTGERKGAKVYRCSFCGKGQQQVLRLIAGPQGVYICNECVGLCNEIIAEEHTNRPEAFPLGVPAPEGQAGPAVVIAGTPDAGAWYLSPEQAATFLGVHTQTIRGYIRAGKLRAYRLAGERIIRIARADLLALLQPLGREEDI